MISMAISSVVMLALCIHCLTRNHSYFSVTMLVILSYLLIDYLKSTWFILKVYSKNKQLMESSYNLTVYHNQTRYLFKKLRMYYVFKKCCFDTNQYYWRVKTNDSKYYYTNTDNEKATTNNIVKTLKLLEIKEGMIADFFEYCLISFLADEEIKILELLNQGQPCTREGFEIRTKEYFLNHEKHFDRQDLPTIVLVVKGKEMWIIDAYDGNSESEIKQLLNSHQSNFKNANIMIFASMIDKREHTIHESNTFRFFTQKKSSSSSLIQEDSFNVGSLTISSKKLNTKYFKEYEIFSSEFYHWELCNHKQRLVKQKHEHNHH